MPCACLSIAKPGSCCKWKVFTTTPLTLVLWRSVLSKALVTARVASGKNIGNLIFSASKRSMLAIIPKARYNEPVMTLKIYKKKLEYSYSFGIHPTIELLESRPQSVSTVLLSADTQESDGIAKIKALCKRNNINFDYADKAISKLAIKEKTHVIGVFKKFKSPLKANENHVVLVNPSIPGNLGTIIRSMVGFNFTNLAIIYPASDIFDPTAVRASMGAVFKVNYEYYPSFLQYLEDFKGQNIYPFVLNGKNKLTNMRFTKPSTLVFGNEGSGLSEYFDQFKESVTIEHSKNVESLNLSSAVSISLYEFSKNK